MILTALTLTNHAHIYVAL